MEFSSVAKGRARAGALVAVAAIGIAGSVAAPAADPGSACTARSGVRTAALLELYTSEGCSSCPPADRWLSSSFPPGATASDAIALAFHVDYWDRLGWTDRFASAAFTQRQYAAASTGGVSIVYTPQVLLQGRELSAWGTPAAARRSLARVTAKPARADIALEALPRGDAIAVKANAKVRDVSAGESSALLVALTTNGLVSDVKAGENGGVTLHHDHVVRTLTKPVRVGAAGTADVDVVLPLPVESGTGTSVVAFVQNTRTGEVLQAVDLALTGVCAVSR